MGEGHCLQAMKIVHTYANSWFNWLISEQQSVNPSRDVISIGCLKNLLESGAHKTAFLDTFT